MDVISYDNFNSDDQRMNAVAVSFSGGIETASQYVPGSTNHFTYTSGRKQMRPVGGRGFYYGPSGNWGMRTTMKYNAVKQMDGASGILKQRESLNAYQNKSANLGRLGYVDPQLPRGGSIMRVVGVGTDEGGVDPLGSGTDSQIDAEALLRAMMANRQADVLGGIEQAGDVGRADLPGIPDTVRRRRPDMTGIVPSKRGVEEQQPGSNKIPRKNSGSWLVQNVPMKRGREDLNPNFVDLKRQRMDTLPSPESMNSIDYGLPMSVDSSPMSAASDSSPNMSWRSPISSMDTTTTAASPVSTTVSTMSDVVREFEQGGDVAKIVDAVELVGGESQSLTANTILEMAAKLEEMLPRSEIIASNIENLRSLALRIRRSTMSVFNNIMENNELGRIMQNLYVAYKTAGPPSSTGLSSSQRVEPQKNSKRLRVDTTPPPTDVSTRKKSRRQQGKSPSPVQSPEEEKKTREYRSLRGQQKKK